MSVRRPEIAELLPWIEVRFDRSGGPGGQNVNKVATRVTLLFDFQACEHVTPGQRTRLARRLASRLAADGRLRVVCRTERSQLANRAAAEKRLVDLLADALRPHTPRIATRPTAAAQRRRLEDKRRRSASKRGRRMGGESES